MASAPASMAALASPSVVTPQILTKYGTSKSVTRHQGHGGKLANGVGDLGRRDEGLTHEDGVEAGVGRSRHVLGRTEPRLTDGDDRGGQGLDDARGVVAVDVEGVEVALIDPDYARAGVE